MTAGTAPTWASALESVVVYAQGALCRRVARGTVPADGRVRVRGLPRSLDPHSVRARVLSAPGVRVTEARAEAEAEVVDADAADEARREVDRLVDAYKAVEARRERQLKRIEEVAGLRPVPPGRKRDDPHRRTPVDAWLELADFVDERLTGLHATLRELEEELRRADHELDIAHDRLERAGTDTPRSGVASSYCAVLTLAGAGEAQGGSEVEVEIEYGVPGAVWVPAYRLAHRQGEDSGRLVLRASVAQRSGEDWTGVRIAFATADLRRRTDLPRLRSVRIGRSQPAPAPSGWREPPAGLTDLFSGYDTAGPAPRTEPTAGAMMVAGAVAGVLWREVPRTTTPPPAASGARRAARPRRRVRRRSPGLRGPRPVRRPEPAAWAGASRCGALRRPRGSGPKAPAPPAAGAAPAAPRPRPYRARPSRTTPNSTTRPSC